MTNYYIRTSGSDAAAGTAPATAWASLIKALDTIAAGDTVYIGPGTYVHSELQRDAFGGTNGSPKVFMGDPHGRYTGDDPGLVCLTSVAYPHQIPRYDNLIEWTGDSKYFEFHDIVFLGAHKNAAKFLIAIGDTVGNFGMDGVVFSNCMFFDKSPDGYSSGGSLLLNYGDGDTPVGGGAIVRGCYFTEALEVRCDDNLVASYDIDLLIESNVFVKEGDIDFDLAGGTYSIIGATVRNNSGLNKPSGGKFTYLVYLLTANMLKMSGNLVDYDGPIFDAAILTEPTGAQMHYNQNHGGGTTYDNVEGINNGTGLSVFSPTYSWFGYELNQMYDKYFQQRPFPMWEPIAAFGDINAAFGGGDPGEVPSVDYYGRAFGVNRKGGRSYLGMWNGDYAVVPWNDKLYTWVDPNSAWTGEETINENTSQDAFTATNGSISSNYLSIIGGPTCKIDASMVIHEVWVRPYLWLDGTGCSLSMNFYTAGEAEDLGTITWALEDKYAGETWENHWWDAKKIPNAPAGGWTPANVQLIEARMWKNAGTDVGVYMVGFYASTGNHDCGAVSARGDLSVELTTVQAGNKALVIERAGHYQTTVPVESGTEITISCYARKDANYTGTSPTMFVFNIPGTSADVSDVLSVAAGNWEQLSVTFTPDQTGFASVRLESLDTSPDGKTYFDNLTWV